MARSMLTKCSFIYDILLLFILSIFVNLFAHLHKDSQNKPSARRRCRPAQRLSSEYKGATLLDCVLNSF